MMYLVRPVRLENILIEKENIVDNVLLASTCSETQSLTLAHPVFTVSPLLHVRLGD